MQRDDIKEVPIWISYAGEQSDVVRSICDLLNSNEKESIAEKAFKDPEVKAKNTSL